ncbi:hypothetical protein FI667_g15020, partial [Globisporangium splendens]
MIKAALLSLLVAVAAQSSTVVLAEEESAIGTAVGVGAGVAGVAAATGPGELVVASFELAAVVIPLIGGLFKKKQCRQVACWIDNGKCYQQAADKVQNQVFQGRDGYVIESHGNQGAWVRYWRVRTDVAQSQTIATGKCGDGSSFSVFNCQTTGKVHC